MGTLYRPSGPAAGWLLRAGRAPSLTSEYTSGGGRGRGKGRGEGEGEGGGGG